MDGSMNVAISTTTTLFGGATPPNSFMVETYFTGAPCWESDHGPAGDHIGFMLVPDPTHTVQNLITPSGYKPMGAVNIWCSDNLYVAARG
jgi:hypothetical protein